MQSSSVKQTVLLFLIIISLAVNSVQFSKMKSYERQMKAYGYQLKQQMNFAENEFIVGLQLVCAGINNMKTKMADELSSIATVSSGTSKAISVYALTSYYKSNPFLWNTIWELNNNITNRTNISEVLKKNDLSVLYPVIQKIINNPLDEAATKELDYLVRKYTVADTLLP